MNNQSIVEGSGEMMKGSAGFLLDNWLGWVADLINGLISALGISFHLTVGQLEILLFLAAVVLFWLRAKTILQFLQTYGWAFLIILGAYLVLGPILHII